MTIIAAGDERAVVREEFSGSTYRGKTIRFERILESHRYHSSWIASIEGSRVYAKVAAAEIPEMTNDAGGSSLPLDPDIQVLWRNGIGTSYGADFFQPAPEAPGLAMIPAELAPEGLSAAIPGEIVKWQAWRMKELPGVFPDGVEFFELDRGEKCIVYPFIEATTLREIMGRGDPPSPQMLLKIAFALDDVRSMADGHQDLKPHHILIDEEGKVTFVDPGYRNSSGSYPSLFVTTPRYYPLLHHDLDDRQSLAVIIYEWLTGKHPFRCRIWDDFPRSPGDRSAADGGPYSDEELRESRLRFIDSMERNEETIDEQWRVIIDSLLYQKESLMSTASELRTLDRRLRTGSRRYHEP